MLFHSYAKVPERSRIQNVSWDIDWVTQGTKLHFGTQMVWERPSVPMQEWWYFLIIEESAYFQKPVHLQTRYFQWHRREKASRQWMPPAVGVEGPSKKFFRHPKSSNQIDQGNQSLSVCNLAKEAPYDMCLIRPKLLMIHDSCSIRIIAKYLFRKMIINVFLGFYWLIARMRTVHSFWAKP